MPVVIACSACQGKLSIPERLSGKAVKCPKCGETIRPSAGAAPAPAAVKVAPTPAQSAPAPAAEAPIPVTCPSCQKKLQVKAALAGKAIKCPGCAKVLKVPAPESPARADDDWIDINEPYTPPPAPAETGPVSGEWGEGLMEGHDVPDEMREEIREALRKGEYLVWFDRPSMDVLLHQARLSQLTGILLAVGVPAVMVLLHLFVIKNVPVFVPIILYTMAAAFAAAGIFMALLPGKLRKTADRRACYAITNRRLLIHRGKGARIRFVRGGGVQVSGGGDGFGSVIAYTGLELTRMSRVELRRSGGAGELMFGRTRLLERPYFAGLYAVNKVREVERLIREKLIHPPIDRLLRGESLGLAEKGNLDQGSPGAPKESGAEIPPDTNIKDYVSGRVGAVDPDDPNIKDAPRAAAAAPAAPLYDATQVPADVRERAEAELTAGERILWVGKPEGGPPGRGVLGWLFGGAFRVEPRYTLYALTNRRVLLWYKWGWRGRPWNNREWAWHHWGPLSYYPPALTNLYVEADKRLGADGGSIVFKRAKLTTVVEKQQARGGRSYKKTVEIFHYGLMHIRNVKAVARLLYQTLLEPLRGK